MAIAIDASSPPVATASANTTSTIVTASFTPPAGSLLVVAAAIGYNGSTTSTPFTISDSLSGTWQQDAVEAPSSGGLPKAQICSRLIGSSAAMTVTLTTDTLQKGKNLTVWVLTGAASSSWKGGSNVSTTTLDGSITTTVTGSLVFLAGAIDANATLTADARTTTTQNFTDATDNLQLLTGHATSATGTPGATTLGWTGTLTSPSWAAVEYLQAVAVARPQPLLQTPLVPRLRSFNW